jgi:TonB family protein
MKLRSQVALLFLCLAAVPSSFAWGSKGHKIISRLAVESLPADMPAFLRTPEAVNEIEYLGPEPDRWRSRAEPELNAAQAPDHFIDFEYADLIETLPRQRYQYIAALYAYIAAHPDRAAELRPEKVGFQPYIVSEVWERLKSAMRDYRNLSAARPDSKPDTKPVEAAILFYAGWLSHYVADGSQPLHVTINYDGWVLKENPNGYTTQHGIHSLFETAFVDEAISASDVQPLMTPLHAIGDEWDDYLAYLRHSNSLMERVYQLDKAHGFDGTGTPEAKQFTAERLAAGASMLRDLYVAAWVKSAEPVPEWKGEHAAPDSSAPNATPTSAENENPAAFQPFAGEIYHPGGGVSNPRLIYAPDPRFSDEARAAGYSGVAVVGCIVDTDGTAKGVHIVRKLGHGLDEKAMQAVARYRFAPGQYHGKPVPVYINIEVNFRAQ